MRSSASTWSRRRTACALTSVALTGLLLAGCAGSESSAAAAGAPAAARAAGSPPGTSEQTSGDSGKGFSAPHVATGGSAVVPGLQGRSIIRTATVTVRVKDVVVSSGRAEALAASAGGFVAGEQTQARPDDPRDASAVLTLRVPGDRLQSLLTGLSRLGAMLSQDQSSSDVTDQVIDVNARIQSQQASVDRIRALLAQATTIGQVVDIESELSTREGALESLKGQAKALSEQTSLATVTATLVGPGAAPPVAKPASTGFGHGLSQGWKAFTTATTWLLTALGSVLPFLIVALPLAWALVLLRRRRPVGTIPAAEPVSSPAP